MEPFQPMAATEVSTAEAAQAAVFRSLQGRFSEAEAFPQTAEPATEPVGAVAAALPSTTQRVCSTVRSRRWAAAERRSVERGRSTSNPALNLLRRSFWTMAASQEPIQVSVLLLREQQRTSFSGVAQCSRSSQLAAPSAESAT